jgi:transposase
MTPEKLFHELLGLGLNWEVVESRFERESGTVILEIRERERLWESQRCPKEGSEVFCYDHTEELVWRHLNVFQHRCEIHCRLPRGKCRRCGHIFRVRPPWEGLSMHFTREFEAYALLLMREMPMAKVAEVTQENDTRLWRMLFEHVESAYAELDLANVCYVGVDEMSIRKGHEYISIFADLLKKRVIFATEGKDKQTWARFIETFEKHNGHRHSITQVSMDMSVAYEAGVKEHCRNARVVFDKFHVLANVGKAVDQVRAAELRHGNHETREALAKTQWLWRKNPENLAEEEQKRLGKIQKKNLCTAKAYQMRLVLQDIYKSPTATVARHRLKVWCRWVRWVARFHPSCMFFAMLKTVKAIEAHMDGILAHWKAGLTNAFMEGLISVFSAVKRKARGYRSSLYLITMLYLVAAKLRLPAF